VQKELSADAETRNESSCLSFFCTGNIGSSKIRRNKADIKCYYSMFWYI